MPTRSTVSSSSRSPPSDAGLPAPDSARAVEETLAGLGVRPSRRLGQSFLVDAFVADAEAALVASSDPSSVVEIGGGLGILTEAIVRRGLSPLTVVERDPRLVRFLRGRFAQRARVIEADGASFEIPKGAVVVGNLPFSVATPMLIHWMESRVKAVVAMVQKEVGDRLCASEGSKLYGRLSIVAALYGSVEPFQVVRSSSFFPMPEVEGRVIVFRRHEGELPARSPERVVSVVRTLFSSRRKKLGNLLPRLASSRTDAKELARRAQWPEDWQDRRPETLPPSDFFRLADVLEELRPHPEVRHP
ncbi:MAG: 16S rRNA (adenine(1518)-N(6)/adenine(1519)-N(6))-dimethyltransferase RsmA [Thermoplasmata archaeon]|nr:16S rRNA (adenine(1518)-N(6)/adenine(1519)-N(6))-dimethyltransferase RsmA [Thermoplasmata archaeon]